MNQKISWVGQRQRDAAFCLDAAWDLAWDWLLRCAISIIVFGTLGLAAPFVFGAQVVGPLAEGLGVELVRVARYVGAQPNVNVRALGAMTVLCVFVVFWGLVALYDLLRLVAHEIGAGGMGLLHYLERWIEEENESLTN